MINHQLSELLEPFDEEIQRLIYVVLEHEQRAITYQLNTNSTRLKDIKQKIKEEIEKLSKEGYEA